MKDMKIKYKNIEAKAFVYKRKLNNIHGDLRALNSANIKELIV